MFQWPNNNLKFPLQDSTVLVALRGSQSYGTNTPQSDTDYAGIIIPPIRFRDSWNDSFDQFDWKRGESGRVSPAEGKPESAEEGTFYALKKFMTLAAACNPNVIECLFVRLEDILYWTDPGILLRDNRNLFLSQRAGYTFSGYAMSQLKRIKTHKSWIDSPPVAPPTRSEFGLPEVKIIKGEQMGAVQALIDSYKLNMAPWLEDADNAHKEAFWEGVQSVTHMCAQPSSWLEIEAAAEEKIAQRLGFDSNFYEMVRAEKKYAQALLHWTQYQTWIKNRNPARAELESKYGYDCKHAMHLVRLLRMGEEVLTTGVLHVYREDREELKLIRNGAIPYDELLEWAQTQANKVENISRSKASVLPHSPDQQKLADLYTECLALHAR